MKLNFTEFSYGYGFTENLIRSCRTGPKSAPVFPNLVQEAQLGYDVKINLPGVPVFFQFKLPEIMVRDTAREISRFNLPGLTVPFFRMSLMRRDLSDQHAHLISLAKKFPKAVFYATTLVDTVTAFNQAYRQAGVHKHSALFSPIDIGPLPDGKSHVVSYSGISPVAWRCSEAKEIKVFTFDDLIQSVNERLPQSRQPALEESIRQLREDISPFLPQELRQAESELRARIDARQETDGGARRPVDRARSVSTEILVLKEFSRIGLGVELLIAQPSQSKKIEK